jgi:hypothetical protein
MNKHIITLLLLASTAVASARTIITDKPIPGLTTVALNRNDVENIQKKEDREFLAKDTMRRFSPMCTADILIKTAERELSYALWKRVNGAIMMDKYQTYVDMVSYYTKSSAQQLLQDASQSKNSLNLMARVNGFNPLTSSQIAALRLDGEITNIVSTETPLTMVCMGTIKTKQGDTFTTKMEYTLQWFTKNHVAVAGGGFFDKVNLDAALVGVTNPADAEARQSIAAYQKVYATLQSCYVKKCAMEPHQEDLATKFLLGNISGEEAISKGLRGL